MNYKFKLNKNLYVILFCVFTFGVMFEVTRSNYVLKFHDENIRKIVTKQVHLPEKLKATLKQEQFLVIENPNNPDSRKLQENIVQTLNYMKKQSVVTAPTKLPKVLSDYQGVIITFEELELLDDLSAIEKYVEEGGSVFFAIRPGIGDRLYQLSRKIGIYEIGRFTIAKGIKLTSNILINRKGLVISDDFIENSSLSLGLDEYCRVHAKSMNNTPLLWDIQYKKGKYVVFNGSMLGTKDNRGLIAGSISLMKNDFIYPIMNMKIANIDDFPAPFPEGTNEIIYNEFQMDTKSFYRNIWWPMIQKGAAKYDVKYGGFVIQTYNNKIQPPFSEDMGEQQENLIKYGRELLKMGGEIGIHGYNHQSLTTNQKQVSEFNYKAWKNKEDMKSATIEASNYVKRSFPNLELKSYVPPSNIITETGLSALREAIPTIHVLSSLYLEDPSNRSFVQEFRDDGQIIHLPRITAGYDYTNENKWTIANSLTSIGVFSHFIHPDDILDEERTSTKSWAQLSHEYDSMLNSVKKRYPWLRSMTPSEAGVALQQFSQSTVYIERKGNKRVIYVDNFSGQAYFILRTEKKIKSMKHCTVKKIDKDVYLVIAEKEIFEIGTVE